MIQEVQFLGIMRSKLVVGIFTAHIVKHTLEFYSSAFPPPLDFRCLHQVWFCFQGKGSLDFGELGTAGFESQFCPLSAVWPCPSSLSSVTLGLFHNRDAVARVISCGCCEGRLQSILWYQVVEGLQYILTTLLLTPYPTVLFLLFFLPFLTLKWRVFSRVAGGTNFCSLLDLFSINFEHKDAIDLIFHKLDIHGDFISRVTYHNFSFL